MQDDQSTPEIFSSHVRDGLVRRRSEVGELIATEVRYFISFYDMSYVCIGVDE